MKDVIILVTIIVCMTAFALGCAYVFSKSNYMACPDCGMVTQEDGE